MQLSHRIICARSRPAVPFAFRGWWGDRLKLLHRDQRGLSLSQVLEKRRFLARLRWRHRTPDLGATGDAGGGIDWGLGRSTGPALADYPLKCLGFMVSPTALWQSGTCRMRPTPFPMILRF